jgi:DNA repair protein RecN (Recombination protein N)
MLEDLSVKDFALIDSVSLEFGKGLNILSGETGAGKSILIGSLTFLLGGKADADSVRTGAEEARVSGTLYIAPGTSKARAWLKDHGIEPDNDRILLRRTLRTTGKSSTWIEDTPVTRGELSEFTSFLVDIHGQHDHQSLLKIDEHRRFLDSFAGIDGEVSAFTELYFALAAKRRLRDEMNTSESERLQKIELLTFAADEIRKAALSSDEEAELESEEQRLSQHEKLFAAVDQVSELLSGAEGTIHALKKARAALEQASSIDGALSAPLGRVESSFYELEDVSDSLRQYRDALVFDPRRLEEIEERLSLIYKLKKKYGQTIAEILDYAEDAESQLAQLSDSEASRAKIDSEIAELEKKVYAAGTALSEKRRSAAQTLQAGVESILKTLGMANTTFRVELARRESPSNGGTNAAPTGGTSQAATLNAGPYGFDTIEFLISANSGEPLKPLAKIASGGELSRVMLALKTVLADADESGTLIFDEIDAGIGGEVALSVGGHLKKLSSRKQILCITHLASIAVRADNQIKIEKATESGKTRTRAFQISGPARTSEIARMLAGDGVSAASMQHAEELLSKYAN